MQKRFVTQPPNPSRNSAWDIGNPGSSRDRSRATVWHKAMAAPKHVLVPGSESSLAYLDKYDDMLVGEYNDVCQRLVDDAPCAKVRLWIELHQNAHRLSRTKAFAEAWGPSCVCPPCNLLVLRALRCDLTLDFFVAVAGSRPCSQLPNWTHCLISALAQKKRRR